MIVRTLSLEQLRQLYGKRLMVSKFDVKLRTIRAYYNLNELDSELSVTPIDSSYKHSIRESYVFSTADEFHVPTWGLENGELLEALYGKLKEHK